MSNLLEKSRNAFDAERKPFLWLIPSMLLLVIFNIYPLIYSLIMAFSEYNLLSNKPAIFIGFKNFIDILFNDPRFIVGLRNSMLLIIIPLLFEFILGMLMALLLSINIKGKNIFRSLYMIPMFLMPIVAASIWRTFFDFNSGLINLVVKFFGLQPVEWLFSFPQAIFAASIVDIWQWAPFVAIIILAGIESVSREPIEAAIVDGASGYQLIRYIIVPIIKPVLLIAVFLRLIDLAKFIDVMFILTGGGPGYSTETMSLYIFYKGLKDFDIGYTAALSYIMVIIVSIIMTFLVRYIRRPSK